MVAVYPPATLYKPYIISPMDIFEFFSFANSNSAFDDKDQELYLKIENHLYKMEIKE